MSRARCGEVLREALVSIFERREDVYLLGEDVCDPYGGAFKVTRGLSERWPRRVLGTPISEAAIVGVAGGMALRGLRPIVEIMFGDFVTLAMDQLVNHVAKYRAMYSDQVRVPLVLRTPMGGRRGYGPTHSQSLEKLLAGIDGLACVACSEVHDVGALLSAAVDDDDPVVFVENKTLYGRPLRRPGADGRIGAFLARETADGPYASVTLSPRGFDRADVTIATFGGSVPLALDAAAEAFVADETVCEVVALSRLAPLDIEPVLASVRRSGRLVTLEEGSAGLGLGAEMAAQVSERAWSALRAPVRRVAARAGVVPASRVLEDAALPQVADVKSAVAAAVDGGR